MGRFDLLLGKMVEDTPKKRKGKLPEAQVGDEVDAYLCSIGAYVRTINSSGRKLPNGKWIPSKQGRGISDRLAWLPGGKFLAVELKASGKKNTATEEQLRFLRKIIELGHYGCVAESSKDVRLCLSQTKEEMLAALDNLSARTQSLPLEPLFD